MAKRYLLSITPEGVANVYEAQKDLLSQLQTLVEGYIEVLGTGNRRYCWIIDEEGTIKEKPVNPWVEALTVQHLGEVRGTAVLVRVTPKGDDIMGLTKADVNKIIEESNDDQ